MKKIFLTLLGVFILFCGGDKILADAQNQPSLFIKSDKVPSKIVDSAKHNWQTYLDNITAIECPDKTADSYYLGTPFTLEGHIPDNSAYFPIINRENKSVSYILQASLMPDSPSLTISKQFTDKINEIRKNKIAVSLSLNPSTHQMESSDLSDNYNTVDVLQPLSQNHKISLRSIPDKPIPSYSRNLIPNWKVTEVQTTQPWCMYYSLSTMINSSENKNVTNAKDLLKKQFPKATDQQLLDPKFISKTPISDTFKSMTAHFRYTLDYKNGTLNSGQVKEQIDKKAPIYVSLDNLTAHKDKTKSHGIVIIGYVISDDKSKDAYYYYWNPWWPNRMMTSAKDMKHLPLGADVYSWYAVGINFRKN